MENLKRIRKSEFKYLPVEKEKALLNDGPIVLTSDGDDLFVVMTVDEYTRILPFKQGGEMTRIQGKLFRQVL